MVLLQWKLRVTLGHWVPHDHWIVIFLIIRENYGCGYAVRASRFS